MKNTINFSVQELSHVEMIETLGGGDGAASRFFNLLGHFIAEVVEYIASGGEDKINMN